MGGTAPLDTGGPSTGTLRSEAQTQSKQKLYAIELPLPLSKHLFTTVVRSFQKPCICQKSLKNPANNVYFVFSPFFPSYTLQARQFETNPSWWMRDDLRPHSGSEFSVPPAGDRDSDSSTCAAKTLAAFWYGFFVQSRLFFLMLFHFSGKSTKFSLFFPKKLKFLSVVS